MSERRSWKQAIMMRALASSDICVRQLLPYDRKEDGSFHIDFNCNRFDSIDSCVRKRRQYPANGDSNSN